jgi:phage gp36-like protein
MFLIPSDYHTQISEKHLHQMIGGDETTLTKAELIAVEEMSNFLSIRYDVAAIFAPITEFSASVIYPKHTRISSTSTSGEVSLYRVVAQATTSGASLTDTTQFLPGDTRNPLVVMCAVDIALYHISAAVATMQVPEVRASRYEAAKEWLKGINRGTITANLPLKETPITDRRQFGSVQKFRTR